MKPGILTGWNPRCWQDCTSNHQLTLPENVISDFPDTRYFDVISEDGRIVLAPVRITRADAVRTKMAELGLSDADVAAVVAWARRGV